MSAITHHMPHAGTPPKSGKHRFGRKLLGTIVAAAMMAGTAVAIPGTAMAGGGHNMPSPPTLGDNGSGHTYAFWAWDTPDRMGNARNFAHDHPAAGTTWSSQIDNGNQWSFEGALDLNVDPYVSQRNGACANAIYDQINIDKAQGIPNPNVADYRIVLVGGFLGDNTALHDGKEWYRGLPDHPGDLTNALNAQWDSIKGNLNPGVSGAELDQYREYVKQIALSQTNSPDEPPQVCVVINRHRPPQNVRPHTDATPQGVTAAGT